MQDDGQLKRVFGVNAQYALDNSGGLVEVAGPFTDGLVAVHSNLDQFIGSELDVRIGVGPCEVENLSARVLGYAQIMSEILSIADLENFEVIKISIFSSGPKAAQPNHGLHAAMALAVSLRLVDVRHPIEVSLCSSRRETPKGLKVDVPEDLYGWIVDRILRHSEKPDLDWSYAIEHAAASMFADMALDDKEAQRVVKLSLGGRTEARFWAMRQAVRVALEADGVPTSAAAGMFAAGVRVPWYQPVSGEPTLHGSNLDVNQLIDEFSVLSKANRGLSREARALKRVRSSGLAVLADLVACGDLLNSNFAHEFEIVVA